MYIGIDFGTSYSIAAVYRNGVCISLLPAGKYGIPSVFYYDKNVGVTVGENAEEYGDGDTVINMKREIKMDLLNSKPFEADGKSFTNEQIVAAILTHIVNTAMMVAQTQGINEPLEGVVISVPPRFSTVEKEIIHNAATKPVSEGGAGLVLNGLIAEPVAGLLSYKFKVENEKEKVGVVDFGGGTCDVAIVKSTKGLEKFEVIDSDTLRIGGRDWDSRICKYLTDQIVAQLPDNQKISIFTPNFINTVRKEAVKLKHSFSEKVGNSYRGSSRATINVGGRNIRIDVTKETIESLTNDLLVEIINKTKELMNKNKTNDMKKIVLIGGSSNMPQFIEAMKKAFSDKEILVHNPERAIAEGAAIYASSLEKMPKLQLSIADKAAFSYGISCFNENDDLIISNLIFKGDKLPKTIERPFYPHDDDDDSCNFAVYESSTVDDWYDHTSERGYVMNVVLPLPEGSNSKTKLHAKLKLSASGLLEIVARDENGHEVYGQKQLVLK